MTKEVFKIIDGFPAYRVSNFGNIQSRWQYRGYYYNGFEIEDVWEDKPSRPDKKGYHQVCLCDGHGNKKTIRVHVLVATAFIGKKPFPTAIIRHLDGNPANNRAENLSYGSYVDNENDKIRHGTWNTRNGGASLTPEQVIEIRNRYENGEPQKFLAECYGVSRPTITRIVNYSTWGKI